MKVENVLEVIVGTLLVIIIAVLLMPKEEVSNEPIIIEETFSEYPLIAWHDIDKKGDVVKIKYRVSNRDTFIEVLDDNGKIVHKQPFQRSPWNDGRARDFTYSWTLYDTQDYGDEIPPGEYEIRVCHKYSRNIDLRTWITI
jgi:hypothetical protein